MHTPAPEEIELNKKRAVRDWLAERLAAREEEMADLRAELERFEAQYTIEVGLLYARQDEIDAEIAEEESKLVPDDVEIQKRAEELRRRAEESAARAAAAENTEKPEPTIEARKAYHNLARAIHPDLALDAAEKEKRHGLMAQLNAAYSAGDQNTLNRMAEEIRVSPDLIVGDTVGDQLVRLIRQISQLNRRLKELKNERREAESSELFDLSRKVRAEANEGRDLLRQMAERAKSYIRKSERRLENLRNVNAAAEEYVKDKYGMDISDFR